MAVIAPLEKTELPPVSDESMAVIEQLIDRAFWALMLQDDFDVCQRDIDLLCAGLRYRFAQMLISTKSNTGQ